GRHDVRLQLSTPRPPRRRQADRRVHAGAARPRPLRRRPARRARPAHPRAPRPDAVGDAGEHEELADGDAVGAAEVPGAAAHLPDDLQLPDALHRAGLLGLEALVRGGARRGRGPAPRAP
ncbi:unnamed protein product, partial [Prorocentrum cordatum]